MLKKIMHFIRLLKFGGIFPVLVMTIGQSWDCLQLPTSVSVLQCVAV